MSEQPTLSVAIIAQDEARQLADLLPTLGWADEVVVVDGGSRDDSVALASRLGCQVIERRFEHFAAQRNVALGCARGDWVLMIDADERPTRRMVQELRSRLGREAAAAYRVPIRSRIFGRALRFSGTQDDCPIRLVRRDSATWTGEVHEICQVHGRVRRLVNGLTHDTLPDAAAFLAKMHRYTRLEAQARMERGVSPRKAELWLGPPREMFRRFVWKLGVLDGPPGWAFCGLSALSAWVGAREYRRRWYARQGMGASASYVAAAWDSRGGLA